MVRRVREDHYLENGRGAGLREFSAGNERELGEGQSNFAFGEKKVTVGNRLRWPAWGAELFFLLQMKRGGGVGTCRSSKTREEGVFLAWGGEGDLREKERTLAKGGGE